MQFYTQYLLAVSIRRIKVAIFDLELADKTNGGVLLARTQFN